MCRIEFSLHGKSTIKRVLKINDISEIRTAQEEFQMLQDRYLKIPTIHRKKLEQTMLEFYRSKAKSRYLSKIITNYGSLRAWLADSKEVVKMCKKLRKFQRKASIRARLTKPIETEILNSRITDYFKR